MNNKYGLVIDTEYNFGVSGIRKDEFYKIVEENHEFYYIGNSEMDGFLKLRFIIFNECPLLKLMEIRNNVE